MAQVRNEAELMHIKYWNINHRASVPSPCMAGVRRPILNWTDDVLNPDLTDQSYHDPPHEPGEVRDDIHRPPAGHQRGRKERPYKYS